MADFEAPSILNYGVVTQLPYLPTHHLTLFSSYVSVSKMRKSG